MKRLPRKKRPIDKAPVEGYDSNWEYELHMGLLKSWTHHKGKIPYIVEHMYHPDFVLEVNGQTILLEAKGRFWDYAEYSKYIWINKVLPDQTELVFLFANPSAPMPQAKRRKDGTKRSHAEWAESHGFRWFSEESLPDIWIDKRYRNSKEFQEVSQNNLKEME